MTRFPQNPEVVTIGGSFGWSLTKVLSQKHPDWQFLFVMRDAAKVAEARQTRMVDKFFGQKLRQSQNPDLTAMVKLPTNVLFYSLAEFNARFRGRVGNLFIPAVPSNALATVLTELISAGITPAAFNDCETLSVSKGMENASFRFSHEVIDDIFGVTSVVGLGGNLAFDIIRSFPVLIELAGIPAKTVRVARFFQDTSFTTFRTRNRRKLDLAGPMKNIHSLATGMASEIYGNSSVAAVATLGLAEYEHAAFIVQFKKEYRALARRLSKIPFNFRSVPIGGGAMSDYHLFRFTRNFSAGQKFVQKTRQGLDARQAIAEISAQNTIESFTSALPTRDFLRQMGTPSLIIEVMTQVLSGKLLPHEGMRRIASNHLKT